MRSNEASTHEPAPPASLPKYLADGLPKQTVDTLRDTAQYIDELIEHREQPITPDELPDAADTVDTDDDGNGTIVLEKVKCGDDTCKCASGSQADMHGPYKYRYYRADGTLKSEYIGKPEHN
jgi:hypothetical protein